MECHQPSTFLGLVSDRLFNATSKNLGKATGQSWGEVKPAGNSGVYHGGSPPLSVAKGLALPVLQGVGIGDGPCE